MIARVVLLVSLGLCALPALAGDRDEILEKGVKRYSQFDEELIIRHFFGDRRDGTFLDVGAYHWRRYSTTYYLEAHLGWSGIAIDAQAEFGPGYAKNRPRTKFVRYLVTDHSDTEDAFYRAGPLSSAERSHVERTPEMQGKAKEVRIPTITLDRLLDENGVERIDFLSMDIEGHEPKALAGFDIERFRPELVCIEAAESTRAPIAAYFEEHGYERIDAYLERDKVNWYFRPKSVGVARPPD